MAEAGHVTLAFDAAYQGASKGEPRQTDRPANCVEDIRAGIDLLLTVKGVDANHIGALGIYGGGGYTIEVSKSDKRIKAVATISAFNTGRVRRNGFKDSQVDSILDRFNQASTARAKYATTGEVDYIGELLTHRTHFTQEQLDQIPAGLYRDGTQYYGDTHYHPNSQSRYTAMSLQDLMTFDAEDHAELINQPLLRYFPTSCLGRLRSHFLSERTHDRVGGGGQRVPGGLSCTGHRVPDRRYPVIDGSEAR